MGRNEAAPKMVGSKKKYRSRSTSASSQDSLSSGSYSGSSSDEEGSPREKIQSNSKGNSDFCVRKIEQHTYGRREIEIAEQEMPGIMALRNKAKVWIIDFYSLFMFAVLMVLAVERAKAFQFSTSFSVFMGHGQNFCFIYLFLSRMTSL